VCSGNIYFCNGCDNEETNVSGSVWGIGPYTSDSHRCQAARHAGAITIEGGYFVCEEAPPQNSYQSSTKNGITTNEYGIWNQAYNVRKLNEMEMEQMGIVNQLNPNNGDERVKCFRCNQIMEGSIYPVKIKDGIKTNTINVFFLSDLNNPDIIRSYCFDCFQYQRYLKL